MRRYGYLLFMLLMVPTLVLAGCGGGSGGGETKVVMNNMAYNPRKLEVKAGTTVVWENKDVVDHAVAEGDEHKPLEQSLFKSGDFAPGTTWSHTFNDPGTYTVHCSTPGHAAAGMVMTVTVKK